MRLANNEGVGFRNAANNADLILKVNATNGLEYNGTLLGTIAAALTASRALVSDGSGNVTVATTTTTQVNYLSAATGTTGTTSTNLVFSTSPTLVTPTLGVAAATSINKVAITTPATSATLTLADGKTLTASNTLTLVGTDGKQLNLVEHLTVAAGGAVQLIGNASGTSSLTLATSDQVVGGNTNSADIITRTATQTLTNKTLTSPVINTPTGIAKGDVGLGNVDNTSDATKNAAAVTLTNKTITSPAISAPVVTGAGTITTATNIIDATTATKKLAIDLASATASKTMTVLSAHTLDRTLTLPDATDTLVGKATTDTLTNKTLTSPNIGTQATIKAAGELRFNNAGDTFYTGFKGGNAAANKIWTLPLVDGSSGNAITTDGSGVLSFSAVATDALNQYNVKIGDSGNTAAAANTNLLGTIAATYSTATATMTSATPCVVTDTSHGLATGDRIYFTTTGALYTGLAASTSYVITKIDANSYKLSTTVANALAGTFIATSGSQSGTHTVYRGGFREKTSQYQGQYDGTTVASGYIGQLIEPSSAITSTTATTSEADVNNASLPLTPGVWQIFYSVSTYVTTGSTSGNASYLTVCVTDNSNTHIGKTERVLLAKTVAAVVNEVDACLAASCVVNISASTTYKLRLKRVDNAGTGTAAVYVATNYESTFYAVRIA